MTGSFCFFVGGDPGGVDDCSVAATDLNGVLQDLGVTLNPTQAAFLMQASRCTFSSLLSVSPDFGYLGERPPFIFSS